MAISGRSGQLLHPSVSEQAAVTSISSGQLQGSHQSLCRNGVGRRTPFLALFEAAEVIVERLHIGKDTHWVWLAAHHHHVLHFYQAVTVGHFPARGGKGVQLKDGESGNSALLVTCVGRLSSGLLQRMMPSSYCNGFEMASDALHFGMVL